VTHRATVDFWSCYDALPETVQTVADRAFEMLRSDPRHPSLHLKKVGQLWSARAGIGHRALGLDIPEGILWFWIGSHAEYDRLIG